MPIPTDFSCLPSWDDPLKAVLLADLLEPEFPNTAERLRVSRVFPDVEVRVAEEERTGILEGFCTIRNGLFVPTREYLEGPCNPAGDSLCGFYLFDGRYPDKLLFPQAGRSNLRFRQAKIHKFSFDNSSMHQLLDNRAFADLHSLDINGPASLGHDTSFANNQLRLLRTLRWWSQQHPSDGNSDPVFGNPFFTHLETFHLHSGPLSRHMLEDLAGSPAMRRLKHLGLHAKGPTTERLEVLTDWSGFQGLEGLELVLPDDADEAWLETVLERAPNLSLLGLTGNPGTSLSYLSPLTALGKTGLRSLRLSRVSIPDDVIEKLATWAEHGSLRELVLDRCTLTWKGHNLIGTKVLPHLESFGIQMARWEPVQAGMIFEAGSSNLIDLDLGATQPIGRLLTDWIPPYRYPNLMRLRWRAMSPRGLSFFIARARQLRLVNSRFVG